MPLDHGQLDVSDGRLVQLVADGQGLKVPHRGRRRGDPPGRGQLGAVSLGVTRSQIVDLLGVPADVAGGHRAPEILKYADVQIMLTGDRVTFLSINPSPTRSSHTSYLGWRPTQTTTLSECHEFLQTIQAVTRVDDRTTGGSFKTLAVEGSGVRLAFTDDRLDKIYVTIQDPR